MLTAEKKEAIQALVEVAIRQAPLAGLTLGIQADGEPAFVEGYGFADVAAEVPTTVATRYQIGSITKTFTAAAVMQLVERGDVSLDHPITRYLTDLPPDAADILIRHLLAHTSGLPDYGDPGIVFDFVSSEEYTPDEVVRLLAEEFPALLFLPGTDFHYSNLGFFLLGVLIERVSDLGYFEYLQANILDPLALEATGLCVEGPGPVAAGYGQDRASRELMPVASLNQSLAYASGALCSTAGDLLAWYESLSAGAVVAPELFAEMTTPASLPENRTADYGLGLMVANRNGRDYIGHLGSSSGYRATLLHFPDEALTITLLCNTSPDSPVLDGLILTILRTITRR